MIESITALQPICFKLLNLTDFISEHLTGRKESLFKPDLEKFRPELSSRIKGRSVLVIGGAGSIGSAFIKALLAFNPARLVVVDHNENSLAELVRDLRSSEGYPIPQDFRLYPFDFGEPVFEKLLRQEGPFEIVANFAAHKHVRSEKDPYAIEAMLTNNVFKAKHLLDLLSAHKPERFFCVSTDKAANPVNVMGASKKLMEQLMMAYSAEFPVATARFANVAFSNGSLPAGFLERLKKRQPLSAPLDVARYFVSPEEAGQLCLLACMLAESGEIFFPKMDAQTDVRTFSSIAEALLKSLDYQSVICSTEKEARTKAAHLNEDSKIWPVFYFHSDTTGEKAQEEFFTTTDAVDWNTFSTIGVIKNKHNYSEMVYPKDPVATLQWLGELKAILAEDKINKSALLAVLKGLVPDFQHLETGKNLDQKM